MKKRYIIVLWTLLMMCIACSDWLDVNPKTEVKAEEMFTTEDGFKSALTGIYGRMTNDELYGRDLSFLFLEKLVQRYDNQRDQTDAQRAEIYDYVNTSASKNKLSTIWNQMYRNIANINNLLKNIETNGEYIITPGYRELMKGEALGLRAFHYLDLLRMWGPVRFIEHKSQKTIPWRNEFTPDKAPLMQGDSLMQNILNDLLQAETLLKDDPLEFDHDAQQAFLEYRQHRMNLYAVKALMARAYLWSGDKSNAALKAKEVIDYPGRKLVRNNQEDITLFDETLFGLNMHKMEERLNNYFSEKPGLNQEQLWVSLAGIKDIFEGSNIGINDIRYKDRYGFKFADQQVICRKYLPSSNTHYSEKIPLIRLSEMYYILAECTNIHDGAAKWINIVRNARGISKRNDVVFMDEAQRIDELQKEYCKDFYAEGQFFFFLKRLGCKEFYRCPFPEGLPLSAYVFPIPDDEIEYGSVDQ